MATSSGQNAPSTGNARVDGSTEKYIQSRLAKTSSQVKIADLAGNVFLLLGVALLSLLVLVVVDHWIWELNVWVRMAALVWLATISAHCLVRRILPLFIHRINPLFAAKTIEDSEPNLKNSLINFLLLRDNQQQSREVVYQAVRQQAATGLAKAELHSTVDWHHVIRLGYAFAALFAICGLYTVLSPKDVFQSLSRVAAPWRQIARPSIVRIDDVTPGDASVYYGRKVEVTALIRGHDTDESLPVSLVSRSVDDRSHQQRIVMERGQVGDRFRAVLPGADLGVESDLLYRIEAGDALTREFRIAVLPAPTISVNRIKYDFPEYTKRSSETIQGDGDIRALEGTRVTIVAEANERIGSAYVEFDGPGYSNTHDQAGQATQKRSTKPVLQTVPMSVEVTDEMPGRKAQGRFYLRLKADRTTPWHSRYCLRFVTDAGATNERPVQFVIDVQPDLSPEVELLRPTRQEVDVPIDGQLTVEIRALDPDFALSSLRLRGESNDAEVLNQQLLTDGPRQGQVTVKWNIVPRQLDLNVGDTVDYWVEAADNRTAPRTDEPEPNVGSTGRQRFRVIDPERPERPEDGSQQRDDSSSTSGDNSQKPDQVPDQRKDDQRQDDQRQDDSTKDQSQSEGAEDRQDSPEQRQEDESGQTGQEQQNNGLSEAVDGQKGDSEPQAEGTQNGTGQPDSSTENDDRNSGGGNQPSDNGGSGPSNSPSRQEGSDRPSGTERREESPLSTDGTEDGDAFERILERMREDRDTGDSNGSDSIDSSQQDPTSAENEQLDGSSKIERRSPESVTDSRPPSTPEDGDDNPEDGSDTDSKSAEDSANQRDRQQGREKRDPADKSSDQADPANTAEDESIDSQTGKPVEKPDERRQGGGRDQAAESGDQARSSDSEKQRPPADRENQGQRQNQEALESQETDNARPSTDQRTPSDPSKPENTDRDAPEQSRADDSSRPDSSDGQTDSGDNKGSADSPSAPSDDPSTQSPPPSDSTGPASQQSSPSGATSSQTGDATPPDASATESPTEKANAQYARKATDLALEYLESQRDDPDPELLRRLGWSKDDLEKFVKRWQKMKSQATDATADQRARGKLDQRLRSLGLRPPAGQKRTAEAAGRPEQGVFESGRRTSPPSQYREKYEAFLKSMARQSTSGSDK